MLTEPHVYEAKYGWNLQAAKLVGLALVFCAAVFVVSVPLWFRILAIVFFGGGALVFAGVNLTRRTALRVDSSGVTLCRSPLYPKSATSHYPWSDITQVVIWQPTIRSRLIRTEYVGIRRQAGAPRLTGRFTGPRSQSAAARMAPGIPPGVAATGARATTWTIDRRRLADAVAHFAPRVRLLDTTTGARQAARLRPARIPLDLPVDGARPGTRSLEPGHASAHIQSAYRGQASNVSTTSGGPSPACADDVPYLPR
jgi:hypothetical protein